MELLFWQLLSYKCPKKVIKNLNYFTYTTLNLNRVLEIVEDLQEIQLVFSTKYISAKTYFPSQKLALSP